MDRFANGKFESTSLTSEGKIVLGPQVTKELTTPEPFLWALVFDSDGNMWSGSGTKAILYRVDKQKKEKVSFMPGTSITALVTDKKQYIYAASFPPATIYRYDRNGEGELFAELPSKYIWDMVIDSKGVIYAAGGYPAGIFKINPDKKVEQIFSPADTHVLSLALDDSGSLYAGSSPNGIIYRIAQDGKVSVFNDLDEEEPYRIVWLDNRLVVAANRYQPAPPLPGPKPGQGAPREEPQSFPANQPAPPGQPAPSALYELRPSGAKKLIFMSPDPYILSLLAIDNNSLYVGTGNDGHLYKVEINEERTTLTQLPVSQILAITQYEGNFYIASGSPGEVFSMNKNVVKEGSFESTVNDIGTVGVWGNLWAEMDAPQGTSIKFQTRTGNTPTPDSVWSEWSSEFEQLPHKIDSPPGRYIQYRFRLGTEKPDVTPTVKEINVAYLTANQPPEIADVKITPQPTQRIPPQPTVPQQPGAPPMPPQPPMPPMPPQPPEKNIIVGTIQSAGAVTIRWKVTEPDNDPVVFNIYFRRLP
ncbi:MAG: hypothetical protein AB1546_09210, partial [bacterium]